MRKIKILSHLPLLSLLAFMILGSALTSHKLMAQDDMPNDEETIIPASSNSNGTPPVIIDESDSGAVNDVDEYDG